MSSKQCVRKKIIQLLNSYTKVRTFSSS